MPQSVTWGKWEKLGVMKSIMDIIWVWWRKWGQIQFSITVKPVLSRHPWEWHSIQGECLKLYSATEDWFDCSSWIDWLDQNKNKNENIPDMREGGRGIGFDRNVGWKGGRGGGNLVVPETIFLETKLSSKKEITLTDMADVRGFISMNIAYHHHSHVLNRWTCILTRTLVSWSWASDPMFGARSLTFMFETKPFLIRNEFPFKRSI